MSGPGHTLRPRVARLEDGRYRAEVVIRHPWGDESVYRGGVAASEGEALALTRRLISKALAVEPTMLELPPAWK
jgi:hypothetical protein